jgi:hypothetical protein
MQGWGQPRSLGLHIGGSRPGWDSQKFLLSKGICSRGRESISAVQRLRMETVPSRTRKIFICWSQENEVGTEKR